MNEAPAALRERLEGRVVAEVALASVSALKTVDVLPQSLHGRPVDDVRRYGKLLDLVVDGTHVVVHLMRAGWVTWHDEVPRTRLRPGGKSPVAVRMDFSSTRSCSGMRSMSTQPGKFAVATGV